MVEGSKPAQKKAAPQGAASPKAAASVGDIVGVTNISDRHINTCKGTIPPGKSGKASLGEAKQLSKFLERT